MLKALIKKQFLELFRMYFVDRKTGKARPLGGIIGFFVLFAAIMAYLAGMFYSVFKQMAGPFSEGGFGWAYFAIAGLMATALGVFGSVFNTFAGLYHAKDNDLLLSMPIPPMYILFSRMTGVYALGVLYEAVLLVPALVARLKAGPMTTGGLVFSLLLVPVLGFVITGLTCLLGWFIAVISSKLKNKSFITTFVSLAFLAAYYFVFMRMNILIQNMAKNVALVGEKLKAAAYPAYIMGMAAEGDGKSMLIFTAFAVAIMAVTCFIMAKSFIRIVTVNKGEKKKEYKQKDIKTSSVKTALLMKELKRFTSSSNYMLNCGLGLIFMIASAVVLFVKPSYFQGIIVQAQGYESIIPVVCITAVCALMAMADIAAPSVSLEGKNIWIAQTMPVDTKDVLMAKVKLQALLVLVPSELLTLALAFAIKADVITAVIMCIAVLVYNILTSQVNVAVNLLRPNLEWTSEIVPIKQSMSVFIAMFGGWVSAALITVAGFGLTMFMGSEICLAVISAVIAVAAVLVNRWLKTKGVKIFAEL